ncbi:MAG: hypothetical protein ACYC9Q_14955 [Bacillota bacterium]
MDFKDLVCKNCGKPIYGGSNMAEIVELRVKVWDSDPNPAAPVQVHTTDAGVFCSRKCLAEYLQKGEVKA